MVKTTYKVQKMDCPSEEQLIRMKLNDIGSISKLKFDISSRRITIFHNGQTEEITNAINELKLDSNLLSTEVLDQYIIEETKTDEKKLLISVLLINLSFFIIELISGLVLILLGVLGIIIPS